MWRGRVTTRQLSVLAAVDEAQRASGQPVSGYAVFERLAADPTRKRPVNHGRVFASLRSLTARGLLSVRFVDSAALYSVAEAGRVHLRAMKQ